MYHIKFTPEIKNMENSLFSYLKQIDNKKNVGNNYHW